MGGGLGTDSTIFLSEAPRATARNTAPPRAPNFASRAAGRKPSETPASAPSAPRTAGATALKQEIVAETEAAPEQKAAPDNNVVPIMRKIALTDLTERTCKWPVGDPTQEDFYFCGCESPENSPYCKYHAKLAYQPVSDRRRAG